MDAGTITLIVSLCVALAAAAGGYAFLGRRIEAHDRATKRVATVSRPEKERAVRKASVDPVAQRRRAVADTVKELESKKKSKKISLRAKIEGAGLKASPRTFYIASGLCGALLGLVSLIVVGSPLAGLLAFIAGGLGLPHWILGFLRKRRQKAFVAEFSNALDVIVRGVKSGLPVIECLKIIAQESPAPLGPEFMELIDAQRMGVPLEQGLEKLYERMPVPEVNFFMIVLVIQQKTGGNLSEALGNLARVLRDRKRLRQKIAAMSSEAKASAGIIGSLPIAVMAMMTMTSPDYIQVLFDERVGNFLIIASVLWMLTGVIVMKKMIDFKI